MSPPLRRTALVTGASTGLGLAIAMALARDGWEVAATDLETDKLDALANGVRPLAATDAVDSTARTRGLPPAHRDPRIVPLALDLRRPDSIDTAFDAAVTALGDIDLLVNNAGRALIKPAVDVTWDEWTDVIDTNLKGSFFLAQRFARHCIGRGRPGTIVSIASTHGMTGIAGRSVYGISKGGLIQMTRMLAIEWAEHGIRVNAIAPTTVMTPSRAALLADPDKRAAMLGRIPLGRFPAPEEIGAAVLYLASPAAASITGHTLLLDGGLTAA